MRAREIFTGVGLGLLIGLLLGLSVSNVVGTVISALAALLAVFLGLSPDKRDEQAATQGGRSWRIMGFSFACVAAIVAGILLRTNDVLTPSLDSELKKWTAAGYTPADAQLIVARLRAGAPAQKDDAKAEDNVNPAHAGVLYASPGALACTRLREDRFGSTADWIAEMVSAGGVWGSFGNAIRTLPPAAQKSVAEAAYGLVCQ